MADQVEERKASCLQSVGDVVHEALENGCLYADILVAASDGYTSWGRGGFQVNFVSQEEESNEI